MSLATDALQERDYVVYSGAFCEDTSATAPGSKRKLNIFHIV